MSPNISDYLSVLCNVRTVSDGWMASCPVFGHGRGRGDLTPSLHISQVDGRVLYRCFGDCSQEQVTDALRALMEGPRSSSAPETSRTKTFTFTDDMLARYQQLLSTEWADLFSEVSTFLYTRGISEEVSKQLGFGLDPARFFGCGSSCSQCGERPALVIPRFCNGTLLGVKFRAVNAPDKAHKWAQVSGSSADFLYCADRERVDPSSSVVAVFEGELDAALVRSLGFNAVGIFGTSGVPAEPSARFFESIQELKQTYDRIVLIGDADDPGQRAMQRLSTHIGRACLLFKPLAQPHKDIGDFCQTEGKEETVRWLKSAYAEAELSATVENRPIGEFPNRAMIGALGDLSRVLTDGSLIPPQFVFICLMTIIGLYSSGTLTYRDEPVQPRFYVCLIGERGRTRKSTAMKLAWDTLRPVVEQAIRKIGSLGSGEALATVFAGEQGINRVLYRPDELVSFTSKAAIENSSLAHKCLELFESNFIGDRTKKTAHESDDAHLGIMTSATPQGFEDAWVGIEADEGGLLSRFAIEYAEAAPTKEFGFRMPDKDRVNTILTRIRLQLDALPLRLDIEPLAEKALEDWWRNRPESKHDARLDGFAKRAAMVLAVTSDKKAIDMEVALAVIELAERQSMLRARFFPSDARTAVERFEQKIVSVLAHTGGLSKRDLVKATNASRAGSGGAGVFYRALVNLSNAGMVVKVGTNRRGNPIFGLPEGESPHAAVAQSTAI